MNDCCWESLDNPIRQGRANYICPTCNTNVTMALILYNESIEETTKIKTRKRKPRID